MTTTTPPQEALTFALRLACAENFSDKDAIDAIVNQIAAVKDERGFPEFFNRLDPD